MDIVGALILLASVGSMWWEAHKADNAAEARKAVNKAQTLITQIYQAAAAKGQKTLDEVERKISAMDFINRSPVLQRTVVKMKEAANNKKSQLRQDMAAMDVIMTHADNAADRVNDLTTSQLTFSSSRKKEVNRIKKEIQKDAQKLQDIEKRL